MYAAALLTGPMTDQAPRGDEPPAPRYAEGAGHATFDQLLHVSGEIRDEIRDLGRTLTREWHDWRRSHEEDHRRQDDLDTARFNALEAAIRQEELQDAVRRGRVAMALLAFRWLTEHWQVIAVVLGGAWALLGGLQVNIGEPLP